MAAGGGSILAGLVLGAIGFFVIERDFLTASAFAMSGAVLTYFGFMHGDAVCVGGGLGVTPGVALAYAVVAAGFLAVEKFGASTDSIAHPEMPLQRPPNEVKREQLVRAGPAPLPAERGNQLPAKLASTLAAIAN